MGLIELTLYELYTKLLGGEGSNYVVSRILTHLVVSTNNNHYVTQMVSYLTRSRSTTQIQE